MKWKIKFMFETTNQYFIYETIFFYLTVVKSCSDEIFRLHPAADAQADSRGHNQHNESQISNKTLITIHIDIYRYMMFYDVI